MAYAANALGLKEIAITDHGFRHICGTSKQKLKKARQIIDEINTWSTTKVLLGIEADIISEDGTIDVDNETLSMIDNANETPTSASIKICSSSSKY
jgi:putative hydrolase